MVRLLRVENSEKKEYSEVPTEHRLAGIMDATLLAEKNGDGKYIVDYDSGQYQVINVSGGRIQQFNMHQFFNGSPASDMDRSSTEVNENTNFTDFGALIPESGEVGEPTETTRPSVEEF
jgi:hypothetical protein